MLKLNHLLRQTQRKTNIILPIAVTREQNFQKSTRGTSKSSTSSSSSSSDSDEEKKPSTNVKHKETLNKLNLLLKQIVKEDVVAVKEKLQLAKPINKRTKYKQKSPQHETDKKKMVKALKDVANEIGGDVKQTESELLSKLLTPIEPTIPSMTLSDIMKGMKIDREIKPAEKSRAQQVQNLLQNYKGKPQESKETLIRPKRQLVVKRGPEKVVQSLDLFGSEPLGIFTNKDNLKEVPENKTWQTFYERDLKLSVTHPPSNYFQHMILWTEQNKLWKFPIDNEQGLDEEKKVYFAKHVFLEEHLESWCPPKGPIRHFMELVCVGLSKNSYITVETKIEHIEWYRNYFEDKKKLLQEVGAIPLTDSEKKMIE